MTVRVHHSTPQASRVARFSESGFKLFNDIDRRPEHPPLNF